MKKRRGLKRYYQNLETKNENWFGLNFKDSTNSWFDLWHEHFDMQGFGNNSFKKRKPHLDKLFRHFDLLAEKAKELKTEYQIWATILDHDSSSDALFLHTPNPNQNNFPLKITNLSSKSNLTNTELNNYINKLSGYKIFYGKADENYCVIYKNEVGVGMT